MSNVALQVITETRTNAEKYAQDHHQNFINVRFLVRDASVPVRVILDQPNTFLPTEPYRFIVWI